MDKISWLSTGRHIEEELVTSVAREVITELCQVFLKQHPYIWSSC